jgi:hypothetical protein
MSGLKGERLNVLVTPLHAQQVPATLVVLYWVHAAEQEPEVVALASERHA